MDIEKHRHEHREKQTRAAQRDTGTDTQRRGEHRETHMTTQIEKYRVTQTQGHRRGHIQKDKHN